MPIIRTMAALLIPVALSGTWQPVLSADPAACRGPDSYSVDAVDDLRNLMHPAVASDTAFRKRAQLPLVPDTAIALITDSATCAQAVAAYRQIDTTAQVSSMYVIRVGPVFVASNPDAKAGEWIVNYVFDSGFRYISSFFL